MEETEMNSSLTRESRVEDIFKNTHKYLESCDMFRTSQWSRDYHQIEFRQLEEQNFPEAKKEGGVQMFRQKRLDNQDVWISEGDKLTCGKETEAKANFKRMDMHL